MKNKPSFETAVKVLNLLLEGKTPKQICHELDISATLVSQAKEMFPLFLGLPRKYNRRD